MTEEKRLWDEVLARLPGPFRDSIGVCRNGVFLRRGRAATILADVERNRIVLRRERPPVCLGGGTTETVARLLTDAAFEKVLEGLPLPVAPPLELDDAGKNIQWAPTGEAWAALTRFEDAADLALYATRITGFKYRAVLADALRKALKRQSLTVVWEPEGITVRRKDRTVVIHGDEPMASILLRGGKYGEAGRTVAGVDYGVMRDEDVIAPAVSFLRFEV